MLNRGDELSDLQVLNRNLEGSIYEIPEYPQYRLAVFSDTVLTEKSEIVVSELLGENRLKIAQLWERVLQKWNIPSQFCSSNVREYPRSLQQYADQLIGRSMLIHRTVSIPVRFEAHLRLHGFLWDEYEKAGVQRTESPGINFKVGADLPFPMHCGYIENGLLEEPVIYHWQTDTIDPPSIPITDRAAAEIIQGFPEGCERIVNKMIKQILGQISLLDSGIVAANLNLDFGLSDNSQVVFIGDYFIPGRATWLSGDEERGYDQISPLFHQQILTLLEENLPLEV